MRSYLTPTTSYVGRAKAGAGVFFLWLFLTGMPDVHAAAREPTPSSEECLACHSDQDLKKEIGKGQFVSLFVDSAHLARSPHNTLTCAKCHVGIPEGPHAEQVPKVRCDTCHRKPHEEMLGSVHARLDGKGPSGRCIACHGTHDMRRVAGDGSTICSACHRREATQTARGIHVTARGEGNRNLPTCVTCHTAHAVKSRRDPASPTSRGHIHETCATCHGDPQVIAQEHIARPRVVPLFEQSIHGRAIREKGKLTAATCTDCHGAHEIRRAADPASTIFKRNVATTCSQCHSGEAQRFRLSVHGDAISRGIFAAPTCTDCHGEHAITGTRAPGSRVAPLAVSKTCVACHEATPVVEEFGLATRRGGTFFESFHGLAVRGGSTVVANCASCHGTHNILPSSNPASTINPANLPRTCGQCHPGAGIQLASARIHVAPGMGEHPWVALVRRIYIVLILVTIGGMSLHNGLDFMARLRERWRAAKCGEEEPEPHVAPDVAGRLFERLTVSERIQHLILLSTFTILAISGFALKFPEAWWARPLVWFEEGYAIRGWVHRIAGAVMTLAAVYHLGYLVGTRRGRSQLQAMRPGWRDVREAVGMVAFNVGLLPARPRFQRFSYVEKLEYWAVAWGTFIMAGTGFIMWFQSAVLRRWPLLTIDLATVIHYYEAWLATLAIVVWHFYSVIFRPDVYPMSWAWLSGKLTGRQMAEEHPEELEEILAAEASGDASGRGRVTQHGAAGVGEERA